MTWFNSLAPRERLLLILAGLLTALFILWQFIFSPILSSSQAAERELEAAKRDYAIVNAGLPSLALQNGGTAKAVFDQNAIIDSARAMNVVISRVQPAADGSLQVWLEDAPALTINSFLSQLDSRYSLTTTKAQMTRKDDGNIAAQFTFSPR